MRSPVAARTSLPDSRGAWSARASNSSSARIFPSGWAWRSWYWVWANRELVATFAILFGTALLDVTLFFLMPDCLSCYRCGARYNGAGATGKEGGPTAGGREFGGFDLETHEKHRQIVARTKRLTSDPTHP